MVSEFYFHCRIFFLMSIFFPVMVVASDTIIFNDPTKPIHLGSLDGDSQPTVGLAEVHLQSIFFSEKRKTAVVNKSIFKEGAVFGGFFIGKINKDNIEVKYKDKVIKINLFEKIYLNERTGEISE